MEFAREHEMPFAGNNASPDIGGILSTEEVAILQIAVPQLSLAGLESILRRVYHMEDVRILNMTWKEIVIFFEDYVSSKPKN